MKDKNLFPRTTVNWLLLVPCVLLAILLCLTGCDSGSKPASPSATVDPSAQEDAAKQEYSIIIKTEGDMPLKGIGIYVYTDETLQELESFAKTDEQGKVMFTAKASDSYTLVLDNAPMGYAVEESYPVTGAETEIILSLNTGVGDLANITYELGDVMLDFVVTDCDGNVHMLSELLNQKKAVVLNFWYTACNPCKAEFPYMQEAYEKYSEDIEILALNPVDQDDAVIAAFKEELGLTMPLAQADPNWEKAMQLTAYPTTVVIDRYGMISLIHQGSIQEAETFENIFAFFANEEYEQTTIADIEELPEPEKPGSNADSPIEIGSVRSVEVTVEPGQEVYYHLYRVDKMYLSIHNNDAYVIYNQKTYKPSSGSIGITLSTPDTYTPAQVVFGNSGKDTVTYTVYLDPLKGTVNNPYSLSLGEFETYVNAGNDQGVYYSYQATEAGLLTVQCLGITSGVKYDYTLYNTSAYAMRTLRDDGTEDDDGNDIVSIYCRKGDTIQLIVSTLPDSSNSYPAANFTTKAYFQTGVTEDEKEEEEEKFFYAVTVTDTDRAPIAGVVLSMDVNGESVAMMTGEDGVAYTQQLAGTYDVTLRVPEGFVAGTTKYQLSNEAPMISIKLDKLVEEIETYTITVVDVNNAPISDALVMINNGYGTTDKDGKVSFILPKADYTVTVSLSDGTTADFTFPKDSTELVASMVGDDSGESGDGEDAKVTYTVKVVDYSGKAVSGVLASFGDAMVTTNASGIATAELVPGTYPVELAFAGTVRYYDESKAILTADATSVTIKVADGVEGTYEMIFAESADYKAYFVDVGGTYVTMQSDVINYYLFEPGVGEDGLYRFTTSDPNAEISFWGNTFFVHNSTASTDYANNAFTLNIKSANIGATYVIGVTGASDCILEITRIGDAILGDEDLVPVEWEGESAPTETFTLSGVTGKTMKFVDVTGNAELVYSAADGRYHLNTVTGPVIYVALGNTAGQYRWLPMSDAFAVTNDDAVLNFIQIIEDANGGKVKERYNTCMVQYIECRDAQYGVYPLTDDLIYMIQQGGDYRGWFEEGNVNYIVTEPEEGVDYNEQILWMFNCCYFE